jgi:hypothetical protein
MEKQVKNTCFFFTLFKDIVDSIPAADTNYINGNFLFVYFLNKPVEGSV